MIAYEKFRKISNDREIFSVKIVNNLLGCLSGLKTATLAYNTPSIFSKRFGNDFGSAILNLQVYKTD